MGFLQGSCQQKWLPCDRGRAGPSPSLTLANESPLWLAGQPFLSLPGSAFCKPRLGRPGWPPVSSGCSQCGGEQSLPSQERQDQGKRRSLGVWTTLSQTGQHERHECGDFNLPHDLIRNLSSLFPEMARVPTDPAVSCMPLVTPPGSTSCW